MKPRKLPVEERVKLVEYIWGSIDADQEALPLTADRKAELDRRVDTYELDKNRGRSTTDAVADIRRNLTGDAHVSRS